MTTKKANPANTERAELELPKGYKPMTGGQLRLEVPEREGWHRHWFRGTVGRLKQAQQAGYQFVDPEDVDINNFDIAGDSEEGGSTDLGSRVSVISGDDIGQSGQAGRLYLMECPEGIFEYAQSILQDQLDATADALRGGLVGKGGEGETASDVSKRYVKKGNTQKPFTRRH